MFINYFTHIIFRRIFTLKRLLTLKTNLIKQEKFCGITIKEIYNFNHFQLLISSKSIIIKFEKNINILKLFKIVNYFKDSDLIFKEFFTLKINKNFQIIRRKINIDYLTNLSIDNLIGLFFKEIDDSFYSSSSKDNCIFNELIGLELRLDTTTNFNKEFFNNIVCVTEEKEERAPIFLLKKNH